MRTADQIREDFRAAVQTSRLEGPITDNQRGYLCGLLGKVVGGGDSGDMARHQVLEYLFGKASSKALTKGEGSVVIDWLTDGGGAEVYEVLRGWGAERGQLEMEW